MRKVVFDKPGKRRVVVVMEKGGEETEVRVLVRGEVKGVYDLDLMFDHRASGTIGKVVVKGIAVNGARIKIRGMVKIGPGFRDVENIFEARVLLLDNKSSAEVNPMFEIESNEVRASHAVSVARPDEEQIYYLVSRGLSRRRARDMIVRGFLREGMDEVESGVEW